MQIHTEARPSRRDASKLIVHHRPSRPHLPLFTLAHHFSIPPPRFWRGARGTFSRLGAFFCSSRFPAIPRDLSSRRNKLEVCNTFPLSLDTRRKCFVSRILRDCRLGRAFHGRDRNEIRIIVDRIDKMNGVGLRGYFSRGILGFSWNAAVPRTTTNREETTIYGA